MKLSEVMQRLKAQANPANVEGMARYGIVSKNAFGLTAPLLRALAKEIGTDQKLSLQLWETGTYEGRTLAALIGDPDQVTVGQMEAWVRQFDSWAICDTFCSNLFDRTPFAYRKAVEWSRRREEYVKRAGYVMMAVLAVHDKKAEDTKFLRFLPLIGRGAMDERNFVRKAVNWALRQIGKRSLFLHPHAVKTAEEIRRMDSGAAKWVASDALRELKSPAVLNRLKGKSGRSRVKGRDRARTGGKRRER